MIACKVAAMVPDRVLSLALLNVTGGGFQCFPKVLLYFSYHLLGNLQLVEEGTFVLLFSDMTEFQ